MKKYCAVIVLLGGLGGCATVPSYPSVLALPGSGKSFDEFRANDIQCRNYAFQHVSGRANDGAVRDAAVGTAVGALAGAAIGGRQGAAVGAGAGLLVGSASGAESSRSYGFNAQQRYDHLYIQCMYGNGHKVPVSASISKNMVERSAGLSNGSSIPPPPNYPPSTSTPPDYRPSPIPVP